jgi:putative DNA primase/helicase
MEKAAVKLSDDELDRMIGGEPTSADNGSSEQKAADDWLAAFAKKSNDALAKRAAEKKAGPRPDDKTLIEALARKDHTEYDRLRGDVAETLGIRVGTLDDKVEMLRKKMEPADHELPHWKIEPWPEEVAGDALLDLIRRVFRRYIVLPPDADIALSLWTLHAWTMDAGEISPFLLLVSPTKRCGKTSVLIILFYLTPRSELASNISPSALFRYIEVHRPTLLLDEADSFLKDNEEFRGILDAGHTKAGSYVIRNVEIAGEHKPRRFSTWAPKAIASIGRFADTLDDRGIKVALQRKPPGSKVMRLRRRDSEEFATLRSKAARWAADNFDKLADPDPAVPQVLHDRAADNWRPLLAIADLAGGEWPARARAAALTLSGESAEDALGVELLKDVRLAFKDDEVIRSADLVAELAKDPERPWAEYNKGKPISQRQVARLLGTFGIISDTVHPPDLPQGKGYQRVHLEAYWGAYCGQNTLPDQTDTFQAYKRTNADDTGTTRDFSSVQKGSLYGSKNAKLAYSHAGLYACTDKNGENGGEGRSDQENTSSRPIDDGLPPFGSLQRCAHCNRWGAREQVALPDRPGTAWLHPECEAAWLESSAEGTA